MPRFKMKRPSTGTVLGFVALIIAVAGNTGALAGTSHKITSSEIAKGAITARALAAGAVNSKALAANVVKQRSLAPRAVTARAIATGSIHAEVLGPVALRTAVITAPGNSEGTSIASSAAGCVSGQRMLTGGVAITSLVSSHAAIIESQPADDGTAWAGRISSNSTSPTSADIQVVCLK